jgi:glycine betaine catabolism A
LRRARLEPSLPRAAYWDERFYAREQAGIFWNEWFLIGRDEQFDGPGSFGVLDVAGESIIAIRGTDRRLRAFLNLCRHRGSRLLHGAGTLREVIRCSYHGWTYALDGSLKATPFIAPEDVPADIDGLHQVGVDTWGGFVFVHLAPEAAARQTLLAQLGAAAERTARYPLAALRIGHTLRYEVAANWKVILENFNECYHCGGVHPELCRLVPAFKTGGGAGLDWENGIPHRAGAYTFTASGTSTRALFAGLDENEQTRHKGELIYPNLMLSLAAEHVAAFTLWPQGPAQTTIVCDFLFHPDELVKPGFDPSDAVDFWDLVNRQDWRICESVQDGMRSRAFRFGYYAPMEDASLDIRRYVAARLGDDVLAPDETPAP